MIWLFTISCFRIYIICVDIFVIKYSYRNTCFILNFISWFLKRVTCIFNDETYEKYECINNYVSYNRIFIRYNQIIYWNHSTKLFFTFNFYNYLKNYSYFIQHDIKMNKLKSMKFKAFIFFLFVTISNIVVKFLWIEIVYWSSGWLAVCPVSHALTRLNVLEYPCNLFLI